MNVEYNGIYLSGTTLTGWDETVEYDSSGTNLVGNTINLSFEGNVFPLEGYGIVTHGLPQNSDINTATGYDNDPLAGGFNNRLNLILRNLSIPRANLFVYDDVTGGKIFQAYAYPLADGSVPTLSEDEKRNIDVDNGPKPKNVRVVNVYNEYARIAFSVSVKKIRCLGGDLSALIGNKADPTKGFVVSNRCYTDESLDANFYLTRTFTGRLTLSSPINSVHFYRDMYYPPLESGFKRESVRFAESEDGLSLQYTVTDKQCRTAAPYPATSFNGSISYSIDACFMLRMSLSLTLVGRPDASPQLLISQAFDAVQKKLVEYSNVADGYCENMNISHSIGDPPSVTVSVQYCMFVEEAGEAKEGSTDEEAAFAKMLVPGVKLVGTPIEFSSIEYEGYEHVYERLKSPNPNPYGYDVYNAYDKDYPHDKGEEGSDDSETPGGDGENPEEKEKSPTYGYIKCLATVPCLILNPKYARSSVVSDEQNMPEDTSTKVVQDENGTDYTEKATQSTGFNRKTLTYPYTFYKSDVTYFTDYSRFVLPKAPMESSGTSEPTGDISEIEKQIKQIKEQISELEQKIHDKTVEDAFDDIFGDGESTENPSEPSEEEPEDSLESLKGELKEKRSQLTTLREKLDKLTNCVVVQLTRPIPKARVIIEAERIGRLPSLPDPDSVVTTTGESPIVFTPLKVETQICEPQITKGSGKVSYSLIGTYEYLLSRPYKKGDEVWLLKNPMFDNIGYYPEIVNENGEKVKDVDALKTLYDGNQLTHVTEEQPPIDDEEPDEDLEE